MRIKQLYFFALASLVILSMAGVASAALGPGGLGTAPLGHPNTFTLDVYEEGTYTLPELVTTGAVVLLEHDSDPLDVKNWSDVALFYDIDTNNITEVTGTKLTLFSDMFDGKDDPNDIHLEDFYNGVLRINHRFILESTTGPTVYGLGPPTENRYYFHSDPSEPSGIPEPGSAPMTALGLLGLGAFTVVARRKA